MKTSSIAFVRAIVLSLCLLPTSGFLAMAAESASAPAGQEINQLTPDISEQEQAEINKRAESDLPNDIERPEDDQIIVGVNVNGIPREQGITIYLPLGAALEDVLVPLGALSEFLSYSIVTNAGDKKAEGFFLKEENVFQLDLNNNEVLVAGQKRPLKEGEAEIQQDDIYVRASALEEWFGIKIKLEMSELVLDVTSSSDLPFQERMKRLLNAEKRSKTYRFDPIKPENAELAPYKNFSFPSIYATTSLGLRKSANSTSLVTNGTLQGNQDIAKFETDYTFSGRYNNSDSMSELTGARLTLQRRDPTKQLLGPLHAGKIAFGDITFPSVPLFLGGERGAGVAISSDSRLGARYASNSENFILDGDAPVGYDAELYNNGNFVAFQQIGPDGRFSFENLTLNNGYNHYEVVLYGPQGQKTTIKRDILRGARMLKKGELQYDAAAGLPRSNFLPLAENAQKDRTPGVSGQAFYGFTNFFTMGASAYSGPQDVFRSTKKNFSNSTDVDEDEDNNSERSTGAAVSAAVSFLGMNVQGQVLGADKGRSAYETSVSARPFGYSIGLTHTTYKNFLDQDQEVKSQNELSVSKSFGKFSTSFLVKDRDYLEDADEVIFENITSLNFLGININNDLIRTVSDDKGKDDFEGEFTALKDIYGTRMRARLVYDLDKEAESRFRTLSFSGQKTLTARSSLRAEGIHDFVSKINQLNLTLSRDYERFGLDLNASAASDNSYSMTVGLRVALQPDQKNNYHLVDPRGGGQAALGARAFIDNNNNGIFDNGDKPLESVGFGTSNSSGKSITDKDGVAYLTNLGETPIRLSVVQESIPDIYLAPKFDHRDLIPRRGSTPIIDFPFVRMSEIAGYLVHLKEGVKGVIVKLLAAADGSTVETTETDDDGYFIFPAVKGGNYKVSFGLPSHDDFMSLNIVLDASVEDPEEYQVEASDELAQAAKEAAAVKPSAAADDNLRRMNAPAGDMPNIDDPIDEKDLKKIDEKDIESIITQ